MAVELARAFITLVPSFQGAQAEIAKGLGDLGGAGGKGGKALGGGLVSGFKSAIGPIAAITAGAFGARAIVGWAKEGIDSLSRIETIAAQTSSAIKATGGAANVSAKHIQELGDSLEGMTATESEAVQEGANLLLTFKNIKNGVGDGNQVFDDATKSLVDMARAMGQDPQSAAIQLGKALNDPIAGISALSRVGVTFSDDQKKVIESLVETGDVAGAQKVILQELNSEFGGAGASYAGTYAGFIEGVKNEFGNLQEKILTGVMPALTGIASVALTTMETIDNSPAFQAVVQKVNDLGVGAASRLEGLATMIGDLGKSAEGFTFGGLFEELSQSSPAFAILQTVFESLAPIMPTILQALKDLGPSFAALLIALAPLIPPLVQMVVELLPPLTDLLVSMTPALTVLINDGLIPLAGYLGDLVGGFADIGDTLRPLTSGDIPGFGASLANIRGPLGDTARAAWTTGATIGNAFHNGLAAVQDFVGGALGTLGALPGRIQSALGNLGGTLYNSGRSLIQGFINGISSMIRGVWAKANEVMQTVRNFFPHSPAKVGPFSGAGWTAVATSGQALIDQFTSRFGADVAPVMLGPTRLAGLSSSGTAPSAAPNQSGVDQPIYMDGTFIGWLRQMANGEARMVFEHSQTATAMDLFGGMA